MLAAGWLGLISFTLKTGFEQLVYNMLQLHHLFIGSASCLLENLIKHINIMMLTTTSSQWWDEQGGHGVVEKRVSVLESNYFAVFL